MCSIKLPVGVIENIDRARKQCLWRGNNDSKKGGNLVAWPVVQKSKSKGGLGVINLRLQNDALLLKRLHKFYCKQDIPWVQLIWNKYYRTKVPHASTVIGSFWWKDIIKLNVLNRGIAKCSIADGSTVTFWEDIWSEALLSHRYPALFSFVLNPEISVKEVVLAPDLDSIFHLPLSLEDHAELLDLQSFVQEIDYAPDTKDSWTFLWGNHSYSSRRYYKLVFQNLHTSPIFAKIRKSKCTPRLKFFAWLIFVDQLNTKNMLSRRHFNVQQNSWCVLCAANIEEDIHHLFFSCRFATECWGRLGIQWSQ